MTIKKGSEVFVAHIVGETVGDVAKKLANGKWFFIKEAYVSGEKGKGGFYHLRQAREVILGKKLGDSNIMKWPRLRYACHKAGCRLINVPGGDTPIHYEDEVVVPDFSMSGAYFFVIKKCEIGKLLKEVPLDESAKLRQKQLAHEMTCKLEAERFSKYSPMGRCERLGRIFWNGDSNVKGLALRTGNLKETEFISFTFEGWNGDKVSVAYNCEDTDLGNHYSNIAKIPVPEHGGINLRADVAGVIDPRQFHRLRSYYVQGWSRDVWVLEPNPEMFNHIVASPSRWLGLFDYENNRVIDYKEIAYAKRVTRSLWSINDQLIYEDSFLISELLD